jgi:uncharacterized protein (DUF58 family)
VRSLYLSQRFFIVFTAIAFGFALSFRLRWMFNPMQILFVCALGILLADLLLLYVAKLDIKAQRVLPKTTSLGDKNPVFLHLENNSAIKLTARVLDELPIELQNRDFEEIITLKPKEKRTISYEIRPQTRGEYAFGNLNLMVRSVIGLWARRIQPVGPAVTAVHPSIIHMKEMELRMMHQLSHLGGIKKIRNLGSSYEFEQIKNYTEGDDYRHINWRASGRHATLMVNQYVQEKSQNVYCVIDKSRVMHMPFHGLSLMDYAINSTLALSNIILKKDDKVGLFTFSDVMGSTIQADRRSNHLGRIMQALYKEQQRMVESNYELLYQATHKLLSVRSLLILFTNFESMYALERQLPYLRRIHKSHLLTVIFFENTEIEQLAQLPALTQEGVFQKITARRFIHEKQEMVRRLKQFGIQAVLTKPQDLSVATINKYLELKARGLI